MIPADHTSPNKPPSQQLQPVVDSGSDTNASASAPALGWKPLHIWLVMIAIVLTIIAVIGGVCAMSECFSSSSAASTRAIGVRTANSPAPTSPNKMAAPVAAIVNANKCAPSGQIATTLTEMPTDPTSWPTQMNETSLSPTVEPTKAHMGQMTNAIPTMAPRAVQVTAFINAITLTGRTIAIELKANVMAISEPEELALHWLVYNDTDLNLLPNTPTNCSRLQQRYALAILLVQSNNTKPFLVSIGHECNWNGVICQNDAVTDIYIDTYNNGNVWTGRLSADLGLLPTLVTFTMSSRVFGGRGGLFGTLPTQIGQLTKLTSFDVTFNALSGSLPSQIGRLTNLIFLSVSLNALTGTLPSQIGHLTNLAHLYVYCALSGSLPNQFGQLTNLRFLSVSGKTMTGGFPSLLVQLTNLQELGMSDSQLTGSLPTQLGQMTTLTHLDVSYNYLSGSLPSQIGQLTMLQSLVVSSNCLSGNLPTQIGQLTNLETLQAYTNALTGSLPTQIGLLSNLQVMDVYDNNFVGAMPESVCRLPYLFFLAADCVSEISCDEDCCLTCY
jgi:Leucine-rich repeat (LRR) protein